MTLRYLSAAALLLGLASTSSASEKLIRKVYAVADLVIPINDIDMNEKAKPSCAAAACGTPAVSCSAPKTCEAELLKLIQATVAPGTWTGAGGNGVVDYFPKGMALVVSQTADVHGEISCLLKTLRNLQEREITFEVRFVQVADTVFERLGIDFEINLANERPKAQLKVQTLREHDVCQRLAMLANWHPQKSMLLNDVEVFQLLEAIQGDRRSNVMCAPKLTTFEGQRATIRIGEQQHFLTNVEEVKMHGQTFFVPKTSAEFIGTDLSIQGSTSTDRKTVSVHVRAGIATIEPQVPLVPVTTHITSVYEGGAQGVPVPFTQYIQKPQIEKISVEKTLAIPDGGTALIHCGKFSATERQEFSPPVLSKIPYINRLFKNVGIGREERHLLMLVTARVGRSEMPQATACKEHDFGPPVGTCFGQVGCEARPGTQVIKAPARECCAELMRAESKSTKCCAEHPLPLSDIVQMSQAGLSDAIIVAQIQTTKAEYTLDAAQLCALKDHGVSNDVILAMQYTRPAKKMKAAAEEQAEAPSGHTSRLFDLLHESESLSPPRSFQKSEASPPLPSHVTAKDLRFWMTNKPSTIGYDRLSGSIGP